MRYLIALGSNLGDRAASLGAAARALGALGDVVAVSRVYETAPMYVEEQGAFYNAALALECALHPAALMAALLDVEQQLGRVRTQRFGPRIIDIDLIAAEDLELDTDALTLPHPRMHERPFVLHPLLDVAPNWVHPRLGLSVAALAATLPAPDVAPDADLANELASAAQEIR